MTENNHIQLLRHATLVLFLDGKRLLVDPMLSSKEQMDPVGHCGNEQRIPMVDLPLNEQQLSALIDQTDAVLITHIHRDHWDEASQHLIPHDKTIYCQPVDAAAISLQGFRKVLGVEVNTIWNGWQISRTGGHHGRGEIEKMMGRVSGFVVSRGATRIYIAGDTIWCDEVDDALRLYRPTHIVLNAGGARFLTGGPITMTSEDVAQVCRASPGSKVIAVHMDTVNHCFVTRALLKDALKNAELDVLVPNDGDTFW